MAIHTNLGRLCALLTASCLGMTAERSTAEISTNPNDCAEIWQSIGLPVNNKDLTEEKFVIVCHLGFITYHNNAKKTPDWVIQRMTREQVIGSNTRPDVDFIEEEQVDNEKDRASDDDYRNSGFARGHQAASADYNFNEEFMIDTFVFSNAVPQYGAGFNSGIWSSLERLTRKLAEERDEIYVITGPVYQDFIGEGFEISEGDNRCGNEISLSPLAKASVCDANDQDVDADCEAGVAVPAALFKILYDPQLERANAYLFPNISHTKQKKGIKTKDYLRKFRVTVSQVEDLTGVDFFAKFSERTQRVIEQHCTGTFIR